MPSIQMELLTTLSHEKNIFKIYSEILRQQVKKVVWGFGRQNMRNKPRYITYDESGILWPMVALPLKSYSSVRCQHTRP